MNWKELGRIRIEDLRDKAIRAYFGLIVCVLLTLAIVGLAVAMLRFHESRNGNRGAIPGLGVAAIAFLWTYQVWGRKKEIDRKSPPPHRSPRPGSRLMSELSITDFEPPDPEDWASGRIEFSWGIDVTDRWIWVAVSVLVFGLFAYAFLSLESPSEGVSRIGRITQLALLALVPMGCLIWAVIGTMSARKFGVSVFQMTSGPGRIGERLAGVINLAANVRPEVSLEIELIGLRQDHEGDCAVERILRQAGNPASRTGARPRGRLDIPVSIDIPADCRPTMRAESGEFIRWVLVVRAPHSGYQAEFEVPVLQAGG